MVSKHVEFLLGNINYRIDELDTDKKERARKAEQKKQRRQQEELEKKRMERDELLLKQMNTAREERQAREKTHLNKTNLTAEQQNTLTAKMLNKNNQRQRINYEEERTRETEHQVGRAREIARRRSRVYS